jgi:hypothetical protein
MNNTYSKIQKLIADLFNDKKLNVFVMETYASKQDRLESRPPSRRSERLRCNIRLLSPFGIHWPFGILPRKFYPIVELPKLGNAQ